MLKGCAMVDSKKISMFIAVAVGLGAIIGSGIFVLSGTAIAIAGSDAIPAFIIVGIVAIIIAAEIGELASIMPSAKGAAYSYVREAFGSELAFITGILQYFAYATAISVIALGFGSYLSSLLGFNGAYAIGFAIALIGVLSVVNLSGIRGATRADSYLVVIKIGVLALFIGFAFLVTVFGGHLNSQNFTMLPSQSGLAALFAASIAIFFAYSGFQVISTFASRIKGGAKMAARSLLYSVGISMVIYLLVIIGLLLLLPSSSYGINGDPLSAALTAVHAPYWLIIIVGIGALIATTSAALAMLIGSSRMLYQISEDGLLPKLFRGFNPKRDVATTATLFSAVIGVVMLFSGNIYTIAAISNFGFLFSYLMASLAIIHFRKSKANAGFKIPLYPYLTTIGIVAILLFMFGMPHIALVIGIILIISLIIIYYALREIESKRIVRIRLFR